MNRDRPTVLLVNDCQDTLELIGQYLRERQGCRVLTAADGRRGLEMLFRYEVDVLFLNIQMPVMNGYEVLKVIAGSQALRRVPVVMWTATPCPFNVESFGVPGLDWLQMPHDLPALMSALYRALGRKWDWWIPRRAPVLAYSAPRPLPLPAPTRPRRGSEPFSGPLDLLDPNRPPVIEGWGDLRGEAALRRREFWTCLGVLLMGALPVALPLWQYSPLLAKVLGGAAIFSCWHSWMRCRLCGAPSWRRGAAPGIVLALVILAYLGMAHSALYSNLGSSYPAQVWSLMSRHGAGR